MIEDLAEELKDQRIKARSEREERDRRTREEAFAAPMLARLVEELRLEQKSILLGHANECEELTNRIEELKTEVADLQKFHSRAETFLGSKKLLQEFYRVPASLTE